MSVQAGLRDLGRNNASDWRGIALKKGAAPPLHRSSAKQSSTTSPNAVHATFISPPRNAPIIPAGNSYSNAPMGPVSRAVENENTTVRTGYGTRHTKSDYSLTSGDLDASLPSGASDPLSYPAVVACEPRSGLRSVSDVPVLSMGCEEEEEPHRIAAGEAVTTVGLSGPRGHVSSMPVSQSIPTVAATVTFVPGVTPEDEIVAAFVTTCVGRVVETACTPQGKTLLVAALETERLEVLEPTVREVCDGLRDIAVDAHGCHVLRTLIEACTAEQTEALIAALYPSVILNICTTSQHTRLSLQSLFVRRLVDLWPGVDVLAANAGERAATQQGCISRMRVFERCDVEQKSALVHELLPKFAALSMDAFANYMVQCAIEHSDRTTAAQYVVQCFAGHLLKMSCDKFASNVVEKVVRVCGGVPAVRRLLLDELIFNPAALKELVSDGYGNFVIQSVVEATTNAMELKRVEDRLRPVLVGCPFAAKIEAKLKAKHPGQAHMAGNGHHQSQQQQQQQRRTCSHASQSSTINVYGVAGGMQAQVHPGVQQRSSSYRMEGGQAIAVVPFMAANSNITAIGAGIHNFRHRPYEAPAVQRYRGVNMSSVQVGVAAPATAAPLQVSSADYFKFSMLNARGSVTAAEGSEAKDSSPVYGPSPAARRHLQQQQPFRPPFTGAL